MITTDYIVPKDKIKRFNSVNKMAVDAIASYIELHYIMSKRTDSQFWKDVSSIELTKVQKETIELFLDPGRSFNRTTVDAVTGGHNIFDQSIFLFLYLGYDLLPNNVYSMDDHETL